MTARILVLGATGYTGGLTVDALVRDGARPVLLARNVSKLAAASERHGGLDTEIVDIDDPASLRRVVQPGDVLVTTVGPFLKYGRTAVEVAAQVGAHYIDSTGEGPFIREVFDTWGPIAKQHNAVLLSAFGYDFVPGAYAGALALEAVGDDADTIDITYIPSSFNTSGGTQASVTGMMFEPGYGFHGGRIVDDRIGRDTTRFELNGRTLTGVAIPAAEHFGLPQSYPNLSEVTVRLAFPGNMGLPLKVASPVLAGIAKVPSLASGITGLVGRFRNTESTGGPDATARAGSSSTVIATATTPHGRNGTVTLHGPDPYDITASVLASAAVRCADGEHLHTGACGPVHAFGLDALHQICSHAGLTITS